MAYLISYVNPTRAGEVISKAARVHTATIKLVRDTC